MARVHLELIAPDFAMLDHQGQEVRLSNYRGQKNVLLVFNRGFV
jgi:peroxiredoxin